MRTKRATRVSYKEQSDSVWRRVRALKQYKGKKRSKRDEEEGEEDDDEDWSESRAMKNGNKRRKKGNGTKAKKPVKENHFNALPPELYLDILSYLNPKDLLALARTNHLNRSFLMSKKDSEQLWEKSFQRVGLPVLEAKDWSYPACADLVFSPYCDQTLNGLHLVLAITTANANYMTNEWTERYVLITDIDSMNAKLLELQAQDEEEIESGSVVFRTFERVSTSKRWRQKPMDDDDDDDDEQDTTTRRGSATRSVQRKKKNYREVEEQEEDHNLVWRVGPRFEAFVESRKAYVRDVETDGANVAQVARKVAWQVHQEEVTLDMISRARGFRSIFDTGANSRRREIKRRLGAIEGYEDNDLNCVAMKDLDPFLDGDDIDDEEWESIKPSLLRLVDAAKAKQARKDHQAQLYESQVERKNSLRQFYDSIIDELEEQGQFAPLFEDFLQFKTIRPLWIGKDGDDLRKSITQAEWDDEVDEEEMQAEFEDYHYKLLEKAVRLILSTNEEYPNETELEQAIEKTLEGDLDAFFSNATSIVFCDAGCETTTSMTRPFAA
ncbi:F-box protein [Sporobolomyces salmoneus]|uniref:F-box protein n=1 Tax=Sporobolomyces salmoneus TaxID=183962 RepID=UPI003181C0F8